MYARKKEQDIDTAHISSIFRSPSTSLMSRYLSFLYTSPTWFTTLRTAFISFLGKIQGDIREANVNEIWLHYPLVVGVSLCLCDANDDGSGDCGDDCGDIDNGDDADSDNDEDGWDDGNDDSGGGNAYYNTDDDTVMMW